MLWGILYTALLLISIVSVIFLTIDVHSFGIIKKISHKNKIAAWVISFAAVILSGGIWLIYSEWAAFVVYIHWFGFRIGAAVISKGISAITKKKLTKNYAGDILQYSKS